MTAPKPIPMPGVSLGAILIAVVMLAVGVWCGMRIERDAHRLAIEQETQSLVPCGACGLLIGPEGDCPYCGAPDYAP